MRNVDTQKFTNTFVGEIVNLKGKVCKVVEVNHDVCARLQVLNFFQKFLLRIDTNFQSVTIFN